MAEQTQEIAYNAKMLSLSVSTTDISATFLIKARAVSIETEDDVWLAFDTAATTAVPSIFLKNGKVLNIRDCNFATIHAIVASGTTTVKATYQY